MTSHLGRLRTFLQRQSNSWQHCHNVTEYLLYRLTEELKNWPKWCHEQTSAFFAPRYVCGYLCGITVYGYKQGRIKLFGAPRQWKHFRPLFQTVFLSGGGLPPRQL